MSRLKSATLRMGDPAPAIELLDVGGAPHTLDGDRAGGPALVVFAPGSWSPNTRRQVQELLDAFGEFRERGITVLLVVTESPRTAQRLVPEDGPLFPILIDHDRDAARDYGVFRAFSLDGIGVTRPAAFLVDESGVLRFVYVGQKDGDVLEIDGLLRLTSWLIPQNGHSGADSITISEPLVDGLSPTEPGEVVVLEGPNDLEADESNGAPDKTSLEQATIDIAALAAVGTLFEEARNEGLAADGAIASSDGQSGTHDGVEDPGAAHPASAADKEQAQVPLPR